MVVIALIAAILMVASLLVLIGFCIVELIDNIKQQNKFETIAYSTIVLMLVIVVSIVVCGIILTPYR